MTVADLARLFRYEGWANAEAVTSAQRMITPPESAVRWLAHLAGTGAEWRARLTETKSRLAVWPELRLAQGGAELNREAGEWQQYLKPLTDHDLDRIVVYRNSRGEEHRSTVSDILMHVLLHGSYHRGQIAAAISAAGGPPGYTDFIHPTRMGIL